MNDAIVEEQSIGILRAMKQYSRCNLQWMSEIRISIPDSVTDLLINLGQTTLYLFLPLYLHLFAIWIREGGKRQVVLC